MATWTARDIMDSIDEGKLRLTLAKDEADADAQRRQDELEAGIEAAWAPIIARIKDSTPEWAWQYLIYTKQMPTYRSERVTMIRPAIIDLEAMGQVFAFVDQYSKSEPARFVPATWALSDDDETWDVYPFGGGNATEYSIPGNPDFLIALAQAYDNALGIPELQAEAERRNAERQKAKVEQPPTRVEHDWVGLARLAVGKTMADGNEAAIAYALIGILEQLQLVTVPGWDRD